MLLQGPHVEELAIVLDHCRQQSHRPFITQATSPPHLLLIVEGEIDNVTGAGSRHACLAEHMELLFELLGRGVEDAAGDGEAHASIFQHAVQAPPNGMQRGGQEIRAIRLLYTHVEISQQLVQLGGWDLGSQKRRQT